jgi:hypothetical protein
MPPAPFPSRIVSGGQTGADRAALDWAMRHGLPHGGWCPSGRIAEDGVIPERYRLSETESAGYRQRTRRNIEDSDGTLMVNFGPLDGGTLTTAGIVRSLAKPLILIQLDMLSADTAAARLAAWLGAERIGTLNVAGPRESKRPGIYRATVDLLERIPAAGGKH